MTPADLRAILALLEAAQAADRGTALTGGPALLGVDVVRAASAIDATLILRVEEQIRRTELSARVFGKVAL